MHILGRQANLRSSAHIAPIQVHDGVSQYPWGCCSRTPCGYLDLGMLPALQRRGDLASGGSSDLRMAILAENVFHKTEVTFLCI